MSDLEKLGGVKAAEQHAKSLRVEYGEYASKFEYALIARVKELEQDLAKCGSFLTSDKAIMEMQKAKLQSARELAEMVQRNDWTPWAKKELEAKAREVLEVK